MIAFTWYTSKYLEISLRNLFLAFGTHLVLLMDYVPVLLGITPNSTWEMKWDDRDQALLDICEVNLYSLCPNFRHILWQLAYIK